MACFSPSCNTDQGVYLLCESLSYKLEGVSESKGQQWLSEVGKLREQPAPSTDLDPSGDGFE